MGFHRQGQTVVGAYISDELKEYLDKLTAERGYSTISDSLRAIIIEHQDLISKRKDRSVALTPSDDTANEIPPLS